MLEKIKLNLLSTLFFHLNIKTEKKAIEKGKGSKSLLDFVQGKGSCCCCFSSHLLIIHMAVNLALTYLLYHFATYNENSLVVSRTRNPSLGS